LNETSLDESGNERCERSAPGGCRAGGDGGCLAVAVPAAALAGGVVSVAGERGRRLPERDGVRATAGQRDRLALPRDGGVPAGGGSQRADWVGTRAPGAGAGGATALRQFP